MADPLPSYEGDQPYVFVSYAHADSKVVFPEIRWLQDQGVNVWYDAGIGAGTEWTDYLADKIIRCSQFLYFVSPTSVLSEHCRRELGLAIDEKHPVIAVHIAQTDLPPGIRLSLNNRQSIMRFQLSSVDYRHQLLTALIQSPTQPAFAEVVAPRRRTLSRVVGAIATLAAVGLFVGLSLNWLRGERETPVTEVRKAIGSVAVLPFENLSDDPDEEYFAIGMTDLLATNLGGIGSLRVIARQSATGSTGTNASPAQIASELGVDGLIMGSVFRADEDVRITAQLVDARTNEQVWGDSYIGHAAQIFALQAETARAISGKIGVALTGKEAGRLDNKTIDPEAWDMYFRGRYDLEKYDKGPVTNAVEAFNRALAREPEFALAHADLAHAYLHMVQQGWASSVEYMPLARAAAEEAIRINPELAEAHVSLALVDYRSGRDWDDLSMRFQRAVELNPNAAQAWHQYSHYLTSTAQHDAAVEAAHRAREADPLSPALQMHLAITYYMARRSDETIETAIETLKRSPGYTRIKTILGLAYLDTGDYESATRQLEAVVATTPGMESRGNLAYVYASANRQTEARAILDELLSMGGPPHAIAGIHAGLGDTNAALLWLERAVDANQGQIADLLVNPVFDALHVDARWPKLLRRAGFSEELISRTPKRSDESS